MPDSIMYHEGNRRLQDRFDSRRISDRLEGKLTHTEFSDDDKEFIGNASYFFLGDGRRRRTPGLLLPSRAACQASCALPARPSWRFPIMTATACSRAWAIGKSEYRHAFHRNARQTEAIARQRPRDSAQR